MIAIDVQVDADMLDAFERVLLSDAKEKALYGGSSSGKTTAVQQYAIIRALEEPGDETLIIMETQTDVLVGMFEPVKDMLDAWGIPYVPHESVPTSIELNGHTLYFSPIFRSKGTQSSESFKKYNNVRRVIINEATSLTWEDFLQVRNRTGRTKPAEIIHTFNPIDEQHWLCQRYVLPYLNGTLEPSIAVSHTTHWDNPFLTPEKHQEYEDLAKVDANYYRVYTLGLPGRLEGLIYVEGMNWTHLPLTEWPETIYSDATLASPISLGLDWGYSNDEAAIVAHWEHRQQRYAHQLLYASDLTISDIAAQLGVIYARHNWPRSVKVFADPSRPDNIEELCRHGYNVKKAVNDICYGIDIVKQMPETISDESRDLIREKRGWCWAKDRNGKPAGKPVDKYNHALDAERYSIASSHGRSNTSRFLKYASR